MSLQGGRALLPLLLSAAALSGCYAGAQTQAPAGPITVTAAPVPLDPRDPARTRVGELTYAGGLVLTSPASKAFGGFSGLDVRDDGSFISQSDVGWLMKGRIETDGDDRPTGLVDAQLTPLLDPEGRRFQHKVLADAEDVTFLSDPKQPAAFAISFEGDPSRSQPRVSIYDGPQARERTVYRFEWADTVFKVGDNYSFEALTQCPGESTFLLGSEDGQIARLNPVTHRIENRNLVPPPPENFKLTGLDCLSGGRIFAVYRAFDPFRGWRAMVAALTWSPSAQGLVLRRHELARLEGALTRDNMEGIAALDRPGGRVRLYLISDDNFGDLPTVIVGHQRTLLMAFDWRPPPALGSVAP